MRVSFNPSISHVQTFTGSRNKSNLKHQASLMDLSTNSKSAANNISGSGVSRFAHNARTLALGLFSLIGVATMTNSCQKEQPISPSIGARVLEASPDDYFNNILDSLKLRPENKLYLKASALELENQTKGTNILLVPMYKLSNDRVLTLYRTERSLSNPNDINYKIIELYKQTNGLSAFVYDTDYKFANKSFVEHVADYSMLTAEQGVYISKNNKLLSRLFRRNPRFLEQQAIDPVAGENAYLWIKNVQFDANLIRDNYATAHVKSIKGSGATFAKTALKAVR